MPILQHLSKDYFIFILLFYYYFIIIYYLLLFIILFYFIFLGFFFLADDITWVVGTRYHSTTIRHLIAYASSENLSLDG
jgi:hypothetical protein